MRLLTMDEVQTGMRLGRSVIGNRGRVLLQAGVLLNSTYIRTLVRLGVQWVYISDEPTEPAGAVEERTRIDVARAAETALKTLPLRHDISVSAVQSAIEAMLDDLLRHPDALVALVEVRAAHDHVMTHSANVAVLCILTGRELGLSRPELVELGMGALLHDVGKVVTPRSVLEKEGILTPEEFEVMKVHAAAGYRILKEAKGVSNTVAHVAYQHHEKWDGSGYPRKLRGEEIHLFARICAVADVFDAMASTRTYKKALHHAEALQFIRDKEGIYFDPRVVAAFRRVVAPYPIGTQVLLSSGEIAVIKDVHREGLERPLVAVIKDAQGEYYPVFREEDLSQSDLEIVRHV